MNAIQYVAKKAYALYLERSKGQLSPDDALWIADQYLHENPHMVLEDAIPVVFEMLLKAEQYFYIKKRYFKYIIVN